MHLKSLEIAGFKSFPDKIKLDFSLGITAVVGPNGSGKSNIADAVRWVMGEQSVKSLRGGKMEDIIFSGTEHRRPLGYADVTMVLDNSDKTLAADFTEVSVSRKVFRSGESEFAINGSPCRLKDVHLLFMDTGVGREGYSIIGQGKIEEVLSARSEDRRQLFEEAAGITKFKTRRTETLVKLEREKQNIVRVSDLINEYENQLEPLREQAEEARRFLLLKEQYKSAYINVFLLDADRYEEAIGKIDNDLKNIAAQSENSQMQLQDLRLICETLRESAGHTDDEYRSANRRVVDLTAEMEKKDGEINILREQFSTCEKNIERILREHDKNEKKLIDKGAEKEKFSASFDAAEKELVLAENELNVKQSEFAELENAVREREKHIDAYNEIIIGKMHSLSEAKNVQKDFEQEYFRHEEKKERINSEILHSEAAAEKQETAIVNLNNEIVSIEDEIESSEKKHAAYILALSQLNSESASTENERRETEKTLNECMSRHKILSEMEHDLEGYSRSVKAVLRKKQNDPLFEKN
ncbi:MAG: chromosome segregation protein SMC, partial [Defluviitaleaceae bacterium]|nr:chromosome segregation protein SMC [Defluviitaleaceae bacterium]